MDRTLLTIAILIAKLPEAHGPEAGSPPCVLRMPEDRLCRLLAASGARHKMRIGIIDPDSCGSLPSGMLTGFELKDGVWFRSSLRLPDLVYDRSFAASSRDYLHCREALRKLAQAGVLPLTGGLPGKWAVHQALQSDPLLAAALAPTRPYRREELPQLLQRYPDGLFLKPAAGSQGRGAICLHRDEQCNIAIEGRTRSNQPYRFKSCKPSKAVDLVDQMIRLRRYIVQPKLPLADAEGRPHDVRLLVQKDGRSRWTVTGAVCRVGAAGSITSNLHGGGTAEPAADRLTRLYGSSQAKKLLEDIHHAGLRAANATEQHFGKFAELGFDFGLSQGGQIWLLEANSKPGRQSFNVIGDERTERLSYDRLLAYARKLANSSMPGSTAVTRSNPYAIFPSDYVQEVHS